MKQKTYYECEFCHTQYAEENKCKECEEWHTKPSKIVKATYKHRNSSTSDTDSPEMIDVLMKNGKTVRYKATNIMK